MTAMRRRTMLTGGAAVLAAPSLARAQGGAAARTLRFVPQGNLANVDPVWTTTTLARNHGLMVYDTLFGLDAQHRPKPQMAASHEVSADGLVHTIALRPGLKFHDGEPVRAADCVASIARWSKRDVLGQGLQALLAEMRVKDDATFEIALRRAWPGLSWALGKPSANICAVMPERVAQTDPFRQITDYTGSGPFRFRSDQWVPGSLAAYERFADYVPRDEPADFLAGGKQVHFDRVEWRVMPDPATAAAAMQANEADWWEQPLADLLPVLRRNRDITIEVVNTAGALGLLRFNHLHPPFDNPGVRRAVFPAVDQRAFMQAALGEDPALWSVPAGVFTPGTPLANDAGLEILTGPRSADAAKRALAAAGYRGEPVVLLSPSDLPTQSALSEVAADMLRRIGMRVDLQVMDWGTLVQRRAKREPPAQGGWNAFCTTWEGLDVSVPGSHQPIRGNGLEGWIGWATSERREALRDASFDAADPETARRIAEDIQRVVWDEAPFVPLGLLRPPQAFRRNLTGIVKGGPPLFWNVRRT
jgi:peptide/nickel transport system substrate-binding protein